MKYPVSLYKYFIDSEYAVQHIMCEMHIFQFRMQLSLCNM